MHKNNTNYQNQAPWAQPFPPSQQAVMTQPFPVPQPAPPPPPMISNSPKRMPDGKDALNRPVLGLTEEMFHHVLPSNLTLALSKYLKCANCYLFRGRHCGYRMVLAHKIFDASIDLVKLAAEMNKRQNNLTLIYQADALHESLRILWFTYYDAGFLGDYKNHGKAKEYNAQEALRLFTIVNDHLDSIGRIIGATKKKAQAAKQTNANRVN